LYNITVGTPYMMVGYDDLIFIKEFPCNKFAKFEPSEIQYVEVYAINAWREHKR
jgi:hypothetical protein